MQMAKLEQLKKTVVGIKVLSEYSIDDLSDIDPDEIVMKQPKQLEEQRKELMAKLKQQEKKIEHAKRLEEMTLLQKYCQDQAESDCRLYKEQEEERIANAVSSRKEDIAKKSALSKMTCDKENFLSFLKSQHHGVFMEKFAAYKATFDEVKQQLEEGRNQCRVKRKQDYLIDMKEKKEEEARKAREKAEQEEKERLERQMKIQKEKEREIEERQKGRKKKQDI